MSLFPLSCGGQGAGTAEPPTPTTIPGGGYNGGPVAGYLAVTVVDDATQSPLAVSASVRLGPPAATVPCAQSTDAAGVALFGPETCLALHGPQIVTVSAYGYAPATWFGVAGANVTIPLVARAPSTPPTATVKGTIEGWNELPAAANHRLLAVVGYAQTARLGAPENNLPQGQRALATGGAGTMVPANVCVATVGFSDCAWQLTTRVGKQALVALIFDVDTRGTADENDDSATMTSMAWARGLDLHAGDTVENETLVPLPASALAALPVTVANVPSLLPRVEAIPFVELGDEGRVVLAPQKLDGLTATLEVPRLEGVLAGATLDVLTVAESEAARDVPEAMVWLHGVSATGGAAATSWLPFPTGLTASHGAYSFLPAAGASVHTVELADAAGTAWSVGLFDGTSSFSLPTLDPAPLSGGSLTMTVSAVEVPGFAPEGEVVLWEAAARLTRLSKDRVSFLP